MRTPGEPVKGYHVLKVHVWCNESDLGRLHNRIGELLCPHDHDGPCPIPWSIDIEDEPADLAPADIIAEIATFHPEQLPPDAPRPTG